MGWFKYDPLAERHCRHCGKPLPERIAFVGKRYGGQVQSYCDNACRLRASRRRRAGLAENLPKVSNRAEGLAQYVEGENDGAA